MSGASSFIMPALQTAMGVGATVAGFPQLGIPLATQGASGLAGGNDSGGLGLGLGSLTGGTGTLGSIGNALGLSATGGFNTPGVGSAPTPTAIGQALRQSGLTGIDPSQVTGVSANQAPTATQPGTSPTLQSLNQMAPAAQAIMKAMGMAGGQQGQQPTPQAQGLVQQMPQARGQIQLPQAQTVLPQAAGQQLAGGPQAAGLAGTGQAQLQQILAMLGQG